MHRCWKRPPSGIVLGALALLVLARQGCSVSGAQATMPYMPEESQAERRSPAMSPDQVVDRIRQKDLMVLQTPGAIAPDAVPRLLPLLKDPDSEIRELTLRALALVGGKEARHAAISALRDPADPVRAAAGELLLKHPDKADLQALYTELASNRDEGVREDVARVISRIGDPSSLEPLRAEFAREADDRARHATSLALARLHDPQHRRAYIEELHAPEAPRRAVAVRDFPEVNDASMLPDLIQLLDDQREALDVGTSRKRLMIRVCDVVVMVLDAHFNHPFDFEVQRRKRYSTEELNAAKAVLKLRASPR